MNAEKVTYIEVENEDTSRPKERPPKKNWKIELVKKIIQVVQYISPLLAAKVIFHFFSLPGKVKIKERYIELMDEAEKWTTNYDGDTIMHYRWGEEGPKILLCHGWRSKIADFRRMIRELVAAGYVVEGADMRAHGNSEGKHTTMPEYVEIIKQHIQASEEQYHAVIAYSIGGMSAAMALSELEKSYHPKHLMLIAAPPYSSYIFEDVIQQAGCNHSVLDKMYEMLKKKYNNHEITYYDIREKQELKHLQRHLVYCEDDTILPFEKAEMIRDAWDDATFTHVKGVGHYKIIANIQIVQRVMRLIGVK